MGKYDLEVGGFYVNNKGYEFTVVEFLPGSKVRVIFKSGYSGVFNKWLTATGGVKDRGSPSIVGFGINDADYVVNSRSSTPCPFYRTWVGMIRRCYSPVEHKNQPSYIDCTVCREWAYFSNFRSWMLQQNWKGLDLDKDILVKGNKVYSPSTCIFVPRKLNVTYTNSSNKTEVLYKVAKTQPDPIASKIFTPLL